MRSVLFVDDDPQLLASLRDALRPKRKAWRMAFEPSGEAALRELEREAYDVVVSDMRMPGMDGAALLEQVRRTQPSAVRIMLSGYADMSSVARAAAVAHRFLAKPCPIAELVRVIDRSCTLGELCEREALRRTATGAAGLPSIPAVYTRLSALLEREDASLDEAATIVEQDLAISAKVLQLANSAFFGGARSITRVRDAVVHLGLRTLRSLVLSAGALSAFATPRQMPHFSLDGLQQHSALVGSVARAILPDGPVQDHAVTGGLLHDLGLLVLATEQPDYLTAALDAAHAEGRPLVEIEYERCGVSHAEVGAHLLALWGLPHDVVEAVAYHHVGPPNGDAAFDAVAAVHIADALVNEAAGEGGIAALPCTGPLDGRYLERLGVTDRLPAWRAIAEREVTR